MRRRLLYHAKAINPDPTVTGYELGISEFSYPIVKHSDTTVSPVFRYYYIPKYSDGTEGERVYITQEDETPDFLYVEFTLNSESDADVKEAGTELNNKTGVLTFNEWSDYINRLGEYRTVAIVDMHVGYAPNGSDRASADLKHVTAQQSSVNIYWHTPVVTLSYDDAPAQPEEEGGKIILKPTVKWTQEGYDDDGGIHTETSDDATHAQYVFSSTGDISVDVDGNVTVPSSTVEERHNVGTVTVKVTNQQVIDGEERAGSDTCNIYQEAYTVVPEEVTLGTDVLLFDKDTRDNIIVPKDDFYYSEYPKSRYTPIGLVVIPREHGVYGDKNTIGVLSLMDADIDNPAEGGTHGKVIHGIYSRDWYAYAWIPCNVKGDVIYSTVVDSNDGMGIWKETDAILFPSDMYSGKINTDDTKTAYKDTTVEYGFTSPYNENEGLNTLYLADAMVGNDRFGREACPSVFQDFDSEYKSIDFLHSYNYQTEHTIYSDGTYSMSMFGILKDDSVWRTSSKISFVDTEDFDTSFPENYGVLPAMEACWRYSPENTHEGNWYLPSAGEWGYVVARAKAINDTLATLNSLYGISYSDIGDYGYINTTPEIEDLAGDEYNVITGNFDGGFKAISTNKKGVARPMMRLKATVSSGSIGNTPLPTGYDDIEANNFLDDNRHKSRWCIYRNENACNNTYYPSYNASSSNNCKSGTVYGVLVKSDTDMTILKTDVELFSFDNLTCASGRLNRQFGYYNQDIEAGWYVIQKIEWSDGTTTSNIYPPSVAVGNKLQPTQVTSDGWQGVISIVYDYKNESQLGYDDYTKNTRNSVLAAFRVGYWDKVTAILLHSTQSNGNAVSPVYDGGYGTDTYGSVSLKLPEITADMSDDSLQPTLNYEQTQYTVTIPAGDPFIVGSKDVLRVTFPNTNYTGLGGDYEKFINNAYSLSLSMHVMGDSHNYGLVRIQSNNTNTNLSVSAMGKPFGYEDTKYNYNVSSSPYYNSSTGFVEFDMSTVNNRFRDKYRVRLYLTITVAGLDESFSIPSETKIRLDDV